MAATNQMFDKSCFRCGQQIKLKRNQQDNGWLYFELDGNTTHSCAGMNKKGGSSSGLAPKIASLENAVKDLTERVDELGENIDHLKHLIESTVNSSHKSS